MEFPFIFMLVKWKINPYRAEFWYKKIGEDDFIKVPIEIGNNFNIKIGDSHYCVGSDYDQGKWLSCVSIQKLERKQGKIVDTKLYGTATQCYRCVGTEYFACRMICIGDACNPSSPLAKKICEPPNTSVYLTYVGNEFKVGVSLGINRRWIEQGSDLGVEVARAPGLIARRIEQRIAKEFNLKLQVRNTTKIKTIANINLDEGLRRLSEMTEEIRPIILEELLYSEGILIKNPKIKDFSGIFGDLKNISRIQHIEVESEIEFGGNIIGIRGSIIFVQQDRYYYALDLRKLSSLTFNFLDRDAIVEGQSSLQEWFE